MTILVHDATSLSSFATEKLHRAASLLVATIDGYVAARLQTTVSECDQSHLHHLSDRFKRKAVQVTKENCHENH